MISAFLIPGLFCLLAASICPAQQRGRTSVIAAPGDRTPSGSRIDTPDDFGLGESSSVFSATLQDSELLAVFTRINTTETQVVEVGDILVTGGTVTGINNTLSVNGN